MDYILGVELNHHNAPIAVREKAALNKEQTIDVLDGLSSHYQEIFAISTCNRLSLYAVGKSIQPMLDVFTGFGVNKKYLSLYPDTRMAINNLFCTASGLESQAIGEHQILGQIKSSLEAANKAGYVGPVLNKLVNHAVFTGKKVRQNTNIGKFSTSLATVGFELIEKHGFNLKETTMLVIGTGNMANLVATVLDRTGVKKLYVASHNEERAKQMADDWRGEAITMNQIHEVLYKTDIIIGGTQGEVNLLTEEKIEDSKCTRAQLAYSGGSQKLLIDFGVPRNFNGDLKNVSNVNLYDLDDIKELTHESLKKRYNEIPEAEKIVEEESQFVIDWLNERTVAPAIAEYWNKLENISQEELNWLLPKMGPLDENQKAVIERLVHRMMRRFSNPVFKHLKESSAAHEDEELISAMKVLDVNQSFYQSPKRVIKIGTRGSKLAIAQCTIVVDQLRVMYPEYEFHIKVVKTDGDAGNIDVLGAFTTAIQQELIKENIDIAFHSFKDLPARDFDKTIIAAVPLREDVRDVFISDKTNDLYSLPKGSIVGTGSLRRAEQILAVRPDLKIKHIQGNVDTRISKMKKGEYDAIILAAAGLNRLEVDYADESLMDLGLMLPAAGQGALALETRKDDNELIEILSKINDSATYDAVTSERRILIELGGGCNFPIAVYSTVRENEINIQSFYASKGKHVKLSKKGKRIDLEKLSVELAKELKTNVLKKNLNEVEAIEG